MNTPIPVPSVPQMLPLTDTLKNMPQSDSEKRLQSKIPSSLTPRGSKTMLPHGGLPEIFGPYLANLIMTTGGPDGPIGRQFVAQPELEKKYYKKGQKDPLLEDEHEVAPGLVYKYVGKRNKDTSPFPYYGRALWTITRHCAAYCRFCTRGREVGIAAGGDGGRVAALSHTPHLLMPQIDEALRYIEHEPTINEIILSGGDPMTVNPTILQYVLGKLGELQRKGKLTIVRIGTRAPVHNPLLFRDVHFAAAACIKNLRLMVHINHALELTPQTLAVLNRFRRESGAIVMSQSVLLRGVNDNVETLYNLFTALTAEGIVPYYVFQNDPVYWAQHFTVPVKRAIHMWQELRPKLSGVAATARFVIDTPNGYGKIPVPEGGAWNIDYQKGFKDFQGTRFALGK